MQLDPPLNVFFSSPRGTSPFSIGGQARFGFCQPANSRTKLVLMMNNGKRPQTYLLREFQWRSCELIIPEGTLMAFAKSTGYAFVKKQSSESRGDSKPYHSEPNDKSNHARIPFTRGVRGRR